MASIQNIQEKNEEKEQGNDSMKKYKLMPSLPKDYSHPYNRNASTQN